MSAEPVAVLPEFVECGSDWLPADRDRWQARWIDEGGPDEMLLFHCPDCADREFGDGAR